MSLYACAGYQMLWNERRSIPYLHNREASLDHLAPATVTMMGRRGFFRKRDREWLQRPTVNHGLSIDLSLL